MYQKEEIPRPKCQAKVRVKTPMELNLQLTFTCHQAGSILLSLTIFRGRWHRSTEVMKCVALWTLSQSGTPEQKTALPGTKCQDWVHSALWWLLGPFVLTGNGSGTTLLTTQFSAEIHFSKQNGCSTVTVIFKSQTINKSGHLYMSLRLYFNHQALIQSSKEKTI